MAASTKQRSFRVWLSAERRTREILTSRFLTPQRALKISFGGFKAYETQMWHAQKLGKYGALTLSQTSVLRNKTIFSIICVSFGIEKWGLWGRGGIDKNMDFIPNLNKGPGQKLQSHRRSPHQGGGFFSGGRPIDFCDFDFFHYCVINWHISSHGRCEVKYIPPEVFKRCEAECR